MAVKGSRSGPARARLDLEQREEPVRRTVEGGEGQVHLFQLDGYRFALDVNSGALHLVDEVAWDLLPDYPRLRPQEILQRWRGRHPRPAVEETLRELAALEAAGQLFSPPPLGGSEEGAEEVPSGAEAPPLKALCLHLAHDCNLRCRYCFAGQGSFGGERRLMPREVAEAAVDFLLTASGNRRRLAIDFFGGEPLLNWPVLRATVEYGRRRAAALGKELAFTVTTNALLLDEEKTSYLLEQDISVVLSLDGRPEVHDGQRLLPSGRGSYERVLPRILAFWEASRRHRQGHPEAQAYCYVRGTFTRQNLDFASDALFLVEQGIDRLSLEPVVLAEGELALREEDVPRLEEEYRRLALALLERARAGRPFTFYHFNLALYDAPCLPRRLSGCGAGVDYLAVAPDGSLYPCHQFVGRPGFRLGALPAAGVPDRRFQKATLLAKPACRRCWARFHCGGGCHANAHLFHGDLHRPWEVGCALQRQRLECALAVQAILALEEVR
ncbi:MAG: thioether cross-link-forming SCIFF peptide maturase [Bacillota bacterium]|nr:thioether cross-link-forming SCIFF peptide maturase [Bacillota bacterium]